MLKHFFRTIRCILIEIFTTLHHFKRRRYGNMMFILSLMAILFAFAVAENLHDRRFYENKFSIWLDSQNIIPSSLAQEQYDKRLQNFANNDDFIEQHNALNLPYTLGLNQFSAMSFEEWREYVGLTNLETPLENDHADSIHYTPAEEFTLPSSVDWERDGFVTPVKDQGKCGACWAFSATGALEGAYMKKHGSLKSFSEQQLADCVNSDSGFESEGCDGGLKYEGFLWAKKNGGVCYEEDYPYVSGKTKKTGNCRDDCKKDPKVAPQSYSNVERKSDKALMSAIAELPVAVSIDADQTAFQHYKSGVFTAKCGTDLNHAVLVVGYGTLDDLDFYKVKNSWGANWGMNGYILLERGGNQKSGQCGILLKGVYPNL